MASSIRQRAFRLSPLGLAAGFTGLMVVSAISIAALILFSAHSIDQQSRQRQDKSIRQELSEIVGQVPTDQLSLTTWDEAWQHTYPRFDAKWMDVNIGRFMHSYFKHDDVLIASPTNGVSFASVGDEKITNDPALITPFLPTVARLHEEMAGKSDMRGMSASGLIVLHDRVAIVSVAPILPYGDHIPVSDPPYLHITVKYLDTSLVEFRSKHEFTGAEALVTPSEDPAKAAVPLVGIDGAVVGSLEWLPEKPGSELMSNIGPVAAFIALLLILASLRMSRYLVQQSAELTAREAQARTSILWAQTTSLPRRAGHGRRISGTGGRRPSPG